MKDYQKPCDKCPNNGTSGCRDKDCNLWIKWFKHRWKLINAYAEKALPVYYASLGKGGDGGGCK